LTDSKKNLKKDIMTKQAVVKLYLHLTGGVDSGVAISTRTMRQSGPKTRDVPSFVLLITVRNVAWFLENRKIAFRSKRL